MAALTLDEVLQRFMEVHADTYDYTNVDYKGQRAPVTIICPEHGPFQMNPLSHWQGGTCVFCSGKRVSTATLIDRLADLHGAKYSFDEVVWVNWGTKIKIICPSHGEVYIYPTNALKKTARLCTACVRFEGRLTTEEVTGRMQPIHDNRYDYSEVVYSTMHEAVKIICPKHGPFTMTPANHLAGHTCPSCWQGQVSAPERAWMCAISDQSGWQYDASVRIIDGLGCVDGLFSVPRFDSCLVVEYDGNYWHRSSEQIRRDEEKTTILSNRGHHVVRLRESGVSVLPDISSAALNLHVTPNPDRLTVQNLIDQILGLPN